MKAIIVAMNNDMKDDKQFNDRIDKIEILSTRFVKYGDILEGRVCRHCQITVVGAIEHHKCK